MLTIVSHDSGGAEILSNWILKKKNYNLILKGPAVKIFKKNLKKVKLSKLESVIKKSNLLITGTSWPHSFEIKAIKMAKKLGIRTISFLDHWKNYRIRFFRNNKYCFPDEIWVGDKYAFKIAKKELPNISIKLIPNPYFKNIKKKIKRLEKKKTKKNLLYLCTPIQKKYWGYTQKDAFKYFMGNLHYINVKYDKIILRPHPTESQKKYKWAKKMFKSKILISNQKYLEKDIALSSTVVGCNSNAMVVALLLNRRVISVVPTGKLRNCLPMKKIEHFNLLLKKNEER